MDSIEIGWNKQLPSEVQVFSNKQYCQQHSIQKSTNEEKIPTKKKVQFNCRTLAAKGQAFENTDHDLSGTVRSQTLSFENHDPSSSSTNIFIDELPKIDDKQTCSVRAIIITFIFVILIILAAAIAVGIVFGTIKSDKNTSETTTKNNNQNSFSTISTILMTSSISIGSQSGPPCTSYTTINDPSRSVNQTGLYGSCDIGPLFNESNGGSWIRFIGTGGTIIPLTSPGLYHCGGYLAGWFNDTLPMTVGTVANGSVCFDTDTDPCRYNFDVSVVNCSGFYVYFLPPVIACNGRYCTT